MPSLAQKTAGFDASVVKTGELVPPRVVPPCKPGACPFAGQSVTVLAFTGKVITRPVHELKDEFEAATGAKLNIVEVPYSEFFDNFISDVSNRTGKYDAALAGAWWLGDLVAGDYVLTVDAPDDQTPSYSFRV